jgi:hypothetical protein
MGGNMRRFLWMLFVKWFGPDEDDLTELDLTTSAYLTTEKKEGPLSI